MIIRGASGFGDSVYLYSIVEYLSMKQNNITVLSNYPEVFKDINVRVEPYDRGVLADIDCNYCCRKYTEGTNQFQDMCHLAGVPTDIDLSIGTDWPVPKVIKGFKTETDICLIKSAYTPMNSAMANVKDLIPNYKKIQYLIDNFKKHYIMILVGAGEQLYKFKGIDIDLTNKTTLPEIMGCVAYSDMIISQQGFMTACAEAMDRKIFVMFSGLGFKSQNRFLSSITPEKVITKHTSGWDSDFTHNPELIKHFEEFSGVKANK